MSMVLARFALFDGVSDGSRIAQGVHVIWVYGSVPCTMPPLKPWVQKSSPWSPNMTTVVLSRSPLRASIPIISPTAWSATPRPGGPGP